MSDLSDLYQEVILDHNRTPRNQGVPKHANCTAEGYNPLCGDKLTVHLRVENDVVVEIGFEGAGCAISQASASVMSTVVKGKTRAEVEALFEKFQAVVTGKTDPESDLLELGELAAMAGVSQFPSRVKCATLSWHTMTSAITGKPDPSSTE